MSDILDGLYTSAGCPDEFIKDISKRMQVPHRISFGPMEALSSRVLFDPPEETNMKVPERIRVVDPDVVVNHSNSPDGHSSYELNSDEFEVNPIETRSSLEPLPSTLILNEVSYPDMECLRVERIERTMSSANSSPEARKPQPNGVIASDTFDKPLVPTQHGSPTQVNNSAYPVNPSQELKWLRQLEQRVEHLEREQLARSQWDRIGLLLAGVYFAFRLLRSLVQ